MTEIDSPGVVSPSAPPALEATVEAAIMPMPAVPVYPALLPGPGGDDGPPPYTTLPYSASVADANPWVAVCPGLPSPRHHGGHAPAGVRLGYVDFVPRVRRKKLFSRDDYETFDTLILRANSWLEENPGYNVVACQTVTWMGRRFKDIYADSCAAERSMHAAKSTKFLIGLRLWYHVEGVGCPSGQPSSTAPALVCRTFLPKADERFDQLVHRVNKRLESDRLGGRIVSVEVVRLLCSSQKQYRPQILNPNLSLWKEHADCTKKFVHCVRVYALLTVHQDGYETIGYQDFVPEYNRRNKDNKGYELFSDVMQRASRWIASQQSVRFTNVETINVKIKRNTTFEERCVYSEHRCANHRLNYLTGPNRTTRYIRVVRAFFVVTKGAGGRMDYPSARLTVRTFSPLQLTRPTPGHAAEFEQTRHLVDRVNQWLQVTGASVFSVETVCIKATRCQVQLLGSEATYSENSMTGAWAERWLYHIRLYLDGEYVEPPPALDLVQPAAQV